jgi:alanine racemase
VTAIEAPARPESAVEYSPNAFVVDLGAIAHNTREVRNAVGPGRFFFAALKGNAYGYGLVEAGRVALESGADGVSMVHLRDAIALRRAGITAPILLYCGNLGHPDAVELVERFDITTTLVDADSVELYARLARERVRAFLKVDVGLERLGCAPEDAVALAAAIADSPKLSLEGVYTHMNADGLYPGLPLDGRADVVPFVDWQFDQFRRVLDELERAGVLPPVALAASSPVVRLTPDMNLMGVDVGRLLYGLIPPVPANVDLDLRPAFHSLTSRLIQVKPMRRTQFVEEAGFELREGMRIGIIPMGYGDGLAALTSGEVLVQGRRVALLATFFEHARLDLTDVLDACSGDEVVVIGRQNGAEITLEEVLDCQGFEQAAGLGSLVRETVPRVYVGHE